MLKISKVFLAAIIFLLLVYMLMTKNFDLFLFNTILLGLFMLVMGLDEFLKGGKEYGYLYLVTSLICFFSVAFQIFLFH
ncbi:hypothetical protein CFK37_19495 [Virgibacillus phasianinus]|uniref:DUF3953 domain-containing protein n=1 Tax=Virgibacillus phasianinus TaxID=2017483 RepID=A0A220U8F6_9BACI|nr:hypothetical protein CFK37_19495 [Virgibacillus phasianinus]